MLDFEDNMLEPFRRSNHQVVFGEEDNEMIDLTSDMTLVSESDWTARIDANVSTEFSMSPCFDQCSSPSSNAAFCETKKYEGRNL